MPQPTQRKDMNEIANNSFKLRLSSFISGSFSDNSPLSPSSVHSAEAEVFQTFQQMRSSVGPSMRFGGQVESPFSCAHGVDLMTSSIDAQNSAIFGLRENWLAQMKSALDETGRLSDFARCHRLSSLLDVNVRAITAEEELKNYLQSVANQKLTADLKQSMDVIQKESRILLEESSEGKTEEGIDRKAIELKIYYCHESLERILRSLLFIVTTLNNGGSGFDDSSSSSLQFDRLKPTLLNQTSVETFIMALPQKYNLEVIQIP